MIYTKRRLTTSSRPAERGSKDAALRSWFDLTTDRIVRGLPLSRLDAVRYATYVEEKVDAEALLATKSNADERSAWVRGFSTALADVHRCLLRGFGSREVVVVCRAASLTLSEAKRCGVSSYDLRELRRAGVPSRASARRGGG